MRWSRSPGCAIRAHVYVDDDGETVRLTGVMSVVVSGGVVTPGDGIRVILPSGAHERLPVV